MLQEKVKKIANFKYQSQTISKRQGASKKGAGARTSARSNVETGKGWNFLEPWGIWALLRTKVRAPAPFLDAPWSMIQWHRSKEFLCRFRRGHLD